MPSSKRRSAGPDAGGYIVRQKSKSGQPVLRWTRSATKHRISRARSAFIIQHCGLRFRRQMGWADPLEREERVLFAGDDADGVALEVIAVEIEEEELLVIHSMELRDKYRLHYEEAKPWRR